MQRSLSIIIVLCWYSANATFNVHFKRCFSMFHDVLALTTLQLGFTSLLLGTLLFSTGKLLPVCQWIWRHDRLLLASAMLFLAGTLATNVSLSLLSVGSTQLVKVLEPLFACLLLFLWRGETPKASAALSLCVIILGFLTCISASSAQLELRSICACLVANLCLQGRNILNKQIMSENAISSTAMMLSNSTIACMIQSVLQICATALGLVASPLHRSLLTPSNVSADAQNVETLVPLLLWPPVTFCTYQTLSMVVLSLMHPVTHAVLNTCKRGVVVLYGVVVLHELITMSWLSGMGVALVGVLGFSLSRRVLTSEQEHKLQVVIAMCLGFAVALLFVHQLGDARPFSFASDVALPPPASVSPYHYKQRSSKSVIANSTARFPITNSLHTNRSSRIARQAFQTQQHSSKSVIANTARHVTTDSKD